jgi:VWFA-related protein
MTRCLALVFACAALVTAAAVSQEQNPGQEVFSEVLEVRAVNVEVVATGKDGRRVPGLTAKDFRILLDGEEVPIDYFAEVREGHVVAPVDRQATDLPPSLREVGAGEVVGTNYLVFIDELFSPLRLRREALKVLAGGVERLGPQDRMAIVTFNGRDLKVLSDWAPPLSLQPFLRQAARQKKSLTGIAPATNPVGRGPRIELLVPGLGDPAPNAIQSERNAEELSQRQLDGNSLVSADLDVMEAEMEMEMARRVIAAAAAVQRAFSAPPGRKVMLLLSGGWKIDPFSLTAGTELGQRMMSLSGLGARTILQPLVDASNLLGYTVYPVHLAEAAASLPSSADPSALGSPALAALNRIDQHATVQSNLAFAAAETGGRILVTRGRPLQQIAEDTNSYYWLGFSQSGGDDRRRRLRVEPLRAGLEVRSRSSFVPLSRSARTSIGVETALISGGASDAAPLEVRLGRLKRDGLAAMELPISVVIPLDDVTLLEESRRYIGRLELRVASQDKSGRRSDIPVLPIVIDRESPPARGTAMVYETRLRLRRQEQDLQLALHDLFGAKSFATRIHVEP